MSDAKRFAESPLGAAGKCFRLWEIEEVAPQSFVCQTRHHHHCHLWLGEIIIINIVIIIILLDCEKFKNRHHNFCLSNSPAQHQVSSSCTKAELLSSSVFFSFSHMQIKFTFEAGISSPSSSLLLQSIFPCTNWHHITILSKFVICATLNHNLHPGLSNDFKHYFAGDLTSRPGGKPELWSIWQTFDRRNSCHLPSSSHHHHIITIIVIITAAIIIILIVYLTNIWSA